MKIRLTIRMLGFFLILTTLVTQAEIRAPKSIQRDLEPILIKWDTLIVGSKNFLNVPFAELFAFTYRASSDSWVQIPIQFDEYDVSKGYLFDAGQHDGKLAQNDQVVVMVADLGDKVSENTWVPIEDSKNYLRFEIQVRDPHTNEYGWFYVYRSATFQDTLRTDYIGHTGNDIYTDIYTIGHNDQGIMDHISYPTVRGTRGATQIIDRQKVRLKGKAKYGPLSLEYNDTENALKLDRASYLDGPVRVVQRFDWHITKKIGFYSMDLPFNLIKIFYKNTMEIDGRADLKSDLGCQLLRISIDIHEHMAASRFYNQYNNDIVLNLYKDVVEKKLDIPGTFWSLVAGESGSFLQLLSVDAPIGNQQRLYYHEGASGTDDGTSDTGDMKSWGDVGILLEGNIVGRANLATDLYLFREEVSRQTGVMLAENHAYPLNYWGGIMTQQYDGIAPGIVTLLAAEVGDDYVEISWTAPKEDGEVGGAAANYDLRYATTPSLGDVAVWWDNAVRFDNLPVPARPGENQSVSVGNLDREKSYYFRLRSQDEAGNWSPLSDELAVITTPVELAQFSHEVFDNGVRLSWRTSSESNNYGFEIQRQAETANFVSIGFVPGTGTTTTPHAYSYLDKNITTGRYNYRLKQIDQNGHFNLSAEIEVEVKAPREFSLSQNYPNPFNHETTIDFTLPEVQNDAAVERNFQVELTIYNLLGQKLWTLVTQEKPAGRYTTRWAGENNQGQTIAGGVYFYRLSVRSLQDGREIWNQMRKMIVMP